jgi:hypothetical protein
MHSGEVPYRFLQVAVSKTLRRGRYAHARTSSRRSVSDTALRLDALKVRFPANNRVTAEATASFDHLLASDSASLPEILGPLFTGSRLVSAEFRIKVDAGRLTFEIQTLAAGRDDLPPTLLKELIRVASAMQPEHVDATAPIPLPFGLKKLSVGPNGLTGDTR